MCGISQRSVVGAQTIEADYTWVADLVNDMRNNPISHGLRLGYDADTLEGLAWMTTFVAEEKVMVSMDDFLTRRAAARNSEDPVKAVEPDFLPENESARTGETGGVLSFYNFMDQNSAVSIVMDNLLRQELADDYAEQRFLLSSDFDRMGIDVRSGILESDFGNKNAYYITICFGSSITVYQVQLLNMINMVRLNPGSMVSHVKFNLMEVLNSNPDSLQVFSYAFPPLFMDRTLQQTADIYLDSSENGKALQLFEDSDAAEIHHVICTVGIESPVNTSSPVSSAFSILMENELLGFPDDKTVFDSESTHVGGGINIVNGVWENLIRLALVTGKTAPPDDDKSQIYGVVYRDMDGNQTYSPGEEIPSQRVLFSESENREKYKIVFADNAGHFYASFDAPGSYLLQIVSGEDVMQKEVYIDGNQYIEMRFPSNEDK